MTRCALAFLFFHIERAIVNGESPVSSSKPNKKGSNYKISPIRFGAAEPTSVEHFTHLHYNKNSLFFQLF